MRKFSKTDNNPAAKAAKLDLRKKVLSEVRPASVLDLFCGTGEMYAGAWRNA
jgi:ubiquinone/menaquinone biosynthesis C-methylase UbiE